MIALVSVLRCQCCGRSLLEYVPSAGFWVRIRCRKCGAWNEAGQRPAA